MNAITEGLRPGSAPPLSAVSMSSSGSAAGARSGAGGRGGAAQTRALFPPGCSCGPAAPEAFYRVREALAAALKALATAFKGTHPGLARAVKGVVDELEETGLFD